MLRVACFGLAFAGVASAQTAEMLAPFAVTANRGSIDSDRLAATVRVFTPADLQRIVALDDALRADPAFSLFRRTSSTAANPTAQGVSLRGIGPSGASRTLVLLDGVPLNDPFGGWIAWGQVPTLALATAEIAPGGGSGTWGNAALGGTIALVSAPAGRSGGILQAEAGQYGLRRAELSMGAPAGRSSVRIDARAFKTDGYQQLRAFERGLVDVPLRTEHEALQVRAQRTIGEIETTLTLRRFDDARVNGTRGQRNGTQIHFGSVTMRQAISPERDWQLAIYGQTQSFQSTFTSVALDRASEVPASEQFKVPATALGAALTIEWRDERGATTVGGDIRRVRGETRERFLFVDGGFTRGRVAGGAQEMGGIFLSRAQEWSEDWRWSVSVRADGWRQMDGARRETNLATNAPTRSDVYPDQSGGTWSGTAGLIWTPRPGWRGRASTYRAFRLPTLNELHRPFRVGNVNTEANPALRHESLWGVEAGLDVTSAPLALSLTAFANRLDDAVGNVTIASTPVLISRERQNLDRIEVHGSEARLRWAAPERVGFDVGWLWSEGEVTRARQQPLLVGKRLAQAPRHVVTAGLDLTLLGGWTFRAESRWTDRQFDDDENTLVLAAAGVIDASLSGPLTKRVSLTLAAENIGDRAVPVARGAGGLTNYGAPRSFRGGIRVDW
jgi:outer membrane receptor protein involved in Fe transport